MPAMRTATLFLAAALFASCGGGSTDPSELTNSGEKALGTGDSAAARADFEAALAAMGDDTSHAMYLRAKLGWIEATAAEDSAAAADALIALHAAQPGKVSDRDFNRIAGKMGSDIGSAVKVLDVAKASYPDSEHLDKLGERLATEAKKAGDADALGALEGLGYVGE